MDMTDDQNMGDAADETKKPADGMPAEAGEEGAEETAEPDSGM
jgi:hypothetical protein